jgi:hypothetical protein
MLKNYILNTQIIFGCFLRVEFQLNFLKSFDFKSRSQSYDLGIYNYNDSVVVGYIV